MNESQKQSNQATHHMVYQLLGCATATNKCAWYNHCIDAVQLDLETEASVASQL